VRKFRTHGFLVVLVVSVLLSGCFGLLKPEPNITVTGIKDGMTYEDPVTPVITAKKGTVIKEITLNEEPFESGTELIESKEYTLKVVAEHESSKKTKTFEYKFTLNINKPIITISGVEDSKYYVAPVSVTPVIGTLDPTDTIVVKLNDEDYTLGTAITEVADYTLVVTATNADNKTSEVTISFRIISPKHELKIGSDTTGFGADKGTTTVNTDPTYIKTGETSLKFENQLNNKAAFRIHRRTNYHPDWINDWSPYDRFSFWIYIVDKSKIDTFEFRLYTVSNKHDKGNTMSFDLSALDNGWNRIDFAFEDMMTNMDDLKTMADNDDIWIDIIVRSNIETTTVYFDDFFMYISEH